MQCHGRIKIEGHITQVIAGLNIGLEEFVDLRFG
jgi:hypothetical protein